MQNPLLSEDRPIRFEEIRPTHFRPAVDEAIAASREKVRALKAGEAKDFLRAVDELTSELDHVSCIMAHMEGVVTSAEVREAYAEVQGDVARYYSDLYLDSSLWTAVRAFSESDAAAGLTGPDRRLLDQTVSDFLQNGADLPQEEKCRLSDISVRLAEACTKFCQNALDSSNYWEKYVPEEALMGVPPHVVEAMKEDAAEEGRPGECRVSLKPQYYEPVVTYAADEGLRREIYLASCEKGQTECCDNKPLIHEILSLRRETATILGYDNFSDYVLSDRMAKRGARARGLMADLRRYAEPAFRREKERLRAFKESCGAEGDLEAWDVAFYMERLCREECAFDEEALREYFRFEDVLKGVFSVLKSLYGVNIIDWNGRQVWHEDVLTFWMYDADWKSIGGFYVDPFPRESKQEGAWMSGLVDGATEAPYATVVLNFTPPAAGRPSLLTHYEVRTLFHEFGHLMHHMLSKAKYKSHFGTNVALDFVELPSQVMEHWAWDWETLSGFARHYETGAKLPFEMWKSLSRTRKFMAASTMMLYVGYSEVDLMLHMDYDPSSGADPVAEARDCMQQFVHTRLPEAGVRTTSFTHLFGESVGYASGYYSYKWAEVLDADAFSRFLELGHMTREAGDAFRSAILERGDEEDPSELFRRFVGREPTVDAVLEIYGL